MLRITSVVFVVAVYHVPVTQYHPVSTTLQQLNKENLFVALHNLPMLVACPRQQKHVVPIPNAAKDNR